MFYDFKYLIMRFFSYWLVVTGMEGNWNQSRKSKVSLLYKEKGWNGCEKWGKLDIGYFNGLYELVDNKYTHLNLWMGLGFPKFQLIFFNIYP